MTEKEALIWIVGILGSLCAAAITLDKVLDIIHKYIKKAQAPTMHKTSGWMSWTGAWECLRRATLTTLPL